MRAGKRLSRVILKVTCLFVPVSLKYKKCFDRSDFGLSRLKCQTAGE